jgi:hypothetical protein
LEHSRQSRPHARSIDRLPDSASVVTTSPFTGNGFEAAAASIPCRTIGGDFVDYFDLPNGAFGFVLGDIAGKGPPAALSGLGWTNATVSVSRAFRYPDKIIRRVSFRILAVRPRVVLQVDIILELSDALPAKARDWRTFRLDVINHLRGRESRERDR